VRPPANGPYLWKSAHANTAVTPCSGFLPSTILSVWPFSTLSRVHFSFTNAHRKFERFRFGVMRFLGLRRSADDGKLPSSPFNKSSLDFSTCDCCIKNFAWPHSLRGFSPYLLLDHPPLLSSSPPSFHPSTTHPSPFSYPVSEPLSLFPITKFSPPPPLPHPGF